MYASDIKTVLGYEYELIVEVVKLGRQCDCQTW